MHKYNQSTKINTLIKNKLFCHFLLLEIGGNNDYNRYNVKSALLDT